MKKLSDFQPNHIPRASISEGISIDADDNSLNERSNSQNSLDNGSIDDSTELSNDNKTDQITVKVCIIHLFNNKTMNLYLSFQFAIKEVRDLPQCAAEKVMCRYTFINQKEDQTIISIKPSSDNNNDEDTGEKPRIFSFNHEKVSIKFHLNVFLSDSF
jgi:hypothetical protein